jgi:hypothetical protein
MTLLEHRHSILHSARNCHYPHRTSYTNIDLSFDSQPEQQTKLANMHATSILVAALSALAAASPIQMAKQHPTGVAPPFPIGSGSPPSGFPAPSGAPRPTSVPVPRPIGSADCLTHGQFLCHGPDQWGLCNWGEVQFQRVAAGTQCLDGEIVFAPGFGTNA